MAPRVAQIVRHCRRGSAPAAVGARHRVVVMAVLVPVPMMVVMMAVRVIMVMMAVGADALDMVVVALLRRALVALEAEHLCAVLAQAAVHVDVIRQDAADPLDEACRSPAGGR